MISELDMVVLTRDLSEHGLQKGDVGTIVHVYNGGAKLIERARQRRAPSLHDACPGVVQSDSAC